MMKTVADPEVRRRLIERLRALRPDGRRRWGTLTAHEMLCHLGDATAMVLKVRPRKQPVTPRSRSVVKWVGLWTFLPWPHGWPTSSMLDPKAEGTAPSEFERDRARAIAGIEAIAAAAPDRLEPAHGVFGTMSVVDWQRWAYRHTDHHLLQFGL